jgi:hypothetical protein
MPGWLRNALALVAGIVIGGVVNGLIITLSPSLIPPPAGVDVSNAESLAKGMQRDRSDLPLRRHRGKLHDSRARLVHRARLAGGLLAHGLAGGEDRFPPAALDELSKTEA